MTEIQLRPALGEGTGLGIGNCSPASTGPEHNAFSLDLEAPRAALLLARRYALSISTAATVAALAGYGEARHG